MLKVRTIEWVSGYNVDSACYSVNTKTCANTEDDVGKFYSFHFGYLHATLAVVEIMETFLGVFKGIGVSEIEKIVLNEQHAYDGKITFRIYQRSTPPAVVELAGGFGKATILSNVSIHLS